MLVILHSSTPVPIPNLLCPASTQEATSVYYIFQVPLTLGFLLGLANDKLQQNIGWKKERCHFPPHTHPNWFTDSNKKNIKPTLYKPKALTKTKVTKYGAANSVACRKQV